jgi:hypothetical protein
MSLMLICNLNLTIKMLCLALESTDQYFFFQFSWLSVCKPRTVSKCLYLADRTELHHDISWRVLMSQIEWARQCFLISTFTHIWKLKGSAAEYHVRTDSSNQENGKFWVTYYYYYYYYSFCFTVPCFCNKLNCLVLFNRFRDPITAYLN